MPMHRYEIRNEYSLADPELYRAADKDDPEAVLEGVDMAGLVGVLRQLGDLAEFAAEIFHHLHEEVMATAARGNGLMIRVQQLEAEVPSIEKEFLSQTYHSSFFYNAGVDWHPNLRIDQNIITQGDLPRLVMVSYEECRGPPRLFLLDKFDMAGAGACLKRYTDPSFFKVGTLAMANVDVQSEKKIRKVKKKRPRGRYGGTPEVLTTSHAKLHQLFLEEPDEKSVRKPAHQSKLKRRLNAFPFDSKTGKSYMEKLLKTPSPEHKMLHEITPNLPFQMPTNDHDEADFDVLKLRSLSPARESEGRKIKPPPPIKEDTGLTPFINRTDGKTIDHNICDVPSYLNVSTGDTRSTFDEENGEKDITLYGERITEGSLTGYQSDEIASEIDNYIDAPSTMESEIDTDSELRGKNDFSSSYIKSQPSVSVENEEHLLSQSSNSQSTGDLTIPDERSYSCKREVHSFISFDSSRILAGNIQPENLSAEGFPSADIPEIAIVSASSYQDGNPSADIQAACVSDDREKKTNLTVDAPCCRSVSLSKSVSGDDSPRSTSGEHLVYGDKVPCISIVPNNICHTSDSSAAMSAHLLHEDSNDLEELNQFGNMSSTLKMDNVLSQNKINTEEIICNKRTTLGKLDDVGTKLPDNFASDFTDTAHNGDDITSKVSEGENQDDDLYNEDSNYISDVADCFSCIMEASIGKEFRETSLPNAEAVRSEDHFSGSSIVYQISSEILVLSGMEDSPDLVEVGLDVHDTDFIHEEATIGKEIPDIAIHKSSEVVGLQGIRKANDVTPNDFLDLQSSFCLPESLEDPADKDGTNPDNGIIGLERIDISGSTDLKLLSEVHLLPDESDSKLNQSETALMSCSVPAVFDYKVRENFSLPAGIDKLVGNHITCSEDSGLSEHEKDKISLSGSNRELELVQQDNNYLTGSLGQSDLAEEVDERDSTTLNYPSVICSTENNDHPKSEVQNTVSSSYADVEVEEILDFVDTAQIQSPLGQSGLDTDHESFECNRMENQVCDSNSLRIDCITEETMLQEKFWLPPDRIDQELPDSSEKSSELSSLLPVNHQTIIDQDNNKGLSDLASSFPFVKCPPSVSRLAELQEYGIDVSAYTKDPSGFTFPVSNLFSKTNQMNLDELPPLPPLPPLQWRMGNFERAMSTTEVEKMEDYEVFKEEISPAASTSNAISSLEQMNHFPIQIVPQISLNEENVEQSSPSLKANSMHKTIDLPPKIENEEPNPQLAMPTQKIDEITSSALLVCDEIKPQTSLKEENVEQNSPSLKANSMHGTIDLPPKRENEQQQLVMPAQKSDEVTSLAEEDGVTNGKTVKLPLSCNPLIGSAAFLDKSKLRKVTARDRKKIQKPDERDSLLEQIRAKSFNLKPAVASRPSIQGPKTNLQVAAILEKANAIRQAWAGSDEDDEDNWSDS